MIGPGLRFEGGNIRVEGWNADWTVGSSSANPWVRACVARHGLLALTKEEAVYFIRATDHQGPCTPVQG